MRVLHWKTLLGRRLAGQSIAPLLMGVVLAVCLALSLSGTFFDYGLGRPEWIHQVARGQDESLAVAQIFVHAFFAWTGALLDGVNAAALGLMAAVTWELGRAALVDVVTVLLALLALAALLRFKINSAWLVMGGAVVGLTYQGLT